VSCTTSPEIEEKEKKGGEDTVASAVCLFILLETSPGWEVLGKERRGKGKKEGKKGGNSADRGGLVSPSLEGPIILSDNGAVLKEEEGSQGGLHDVVLRLGRKEKKKQKERRGKKGTRKDSPSAKIRLRSIL